MDFANPVPEPTPITVMHDRQRMRYALVGALALVAGIWIVWIGAWLFGWPLDDLGIEPRRLHGLIGVLTAPLAHASFEHLMSNTLPVGLLATLTLYCYPRAARIALPMIWLLSGAAVWLFARDSVHVGASGIAHGLMLFLFVMGLLRRDRLAVVTSLVVFFLYGGMLLSVLPGEVHISFEYHLAGALSGLLAAFLLRMRDPPPPRKHYSWEDETDTEPEPDDELELPRPQHVPVLWQQQPREDENRVIVFHPRPRDPTPPSMH
ncbi:MAG: rhomboid family intramembrane serine protease [Rhodanobacter sp.]|jgi:membrane associated rhomboid family serine protease|nr:rhomboid family intramembrane serine protease [Rhodanobacter sp.]